MDEEKHEGGYGNEDGKECANGEEEDDLIDEDDYEAISKLKKEKKGNFGQGFGIAIIGYIFIGVIMALIVGNRQVMIWIIQMAIFGVIWIPIAVVAEYIVI